MNLLVDLLRHPDRATRYETDQWAAVLETGQQHLMLGQLANLLVDHTDFHALPDAVTRHLNLALLNAKRRNEVAFWEIGLIRSVIPRNIPIILLKGVAYAAARDFHSIGRLFTDLDILVPRETLDEVEGILFSQGWMPGRVDDYDQRYYREWMHELPPMKHVRRQSIVDIHHAIIPVVSKYSFPTEWLIKEAVEIAPGLFVLSPTDRIVHCAIHALIEGESGKLLRELYDLSALIKQHAGQTSDRLRVLDRARQLGLERLVVPPVEAAGALFGPQSDTTNARRANWLIDAAMGGKAGTGIRVRKARLALLAFSHQIKMPIGLLITHLIRKTLKALASSENK